MKQRLVFLAFLAACLTWAECACAAITATSAGGANSAASAVTTLTDPLTATASVGDTMLVPLNLTGNGTAHVATDTLGNSYTETAICTFNTTNKQSLFYSKITVAIPAATTATGAITTTTVTFATNPGTLAANQVITGSGVTANTLITGGISQWNGTTASATVNNSQTVASESLTVSQSITATWTTVEKAGMAAAVVTGLDTTAPLDISGACTSGTSTTNTPISPTIATGTLNHSSEIVIGVVGMAGNYTGYASNSPFTDLTGTTATSAAAIAWGYDVVAATTSVAYGPQWTTSRSYGANVWTFTAPFSSATTARGTSSALTGAGR